MIETDYLRLTSKKRSLIKFAFGLFKQIKASLVSLLEQKAKESLVVILIKVGLL